MTRVKQTRKRPPPSAPAPPDRLPPKKRGRQLLGAYVEKRFGGRTSGGRAGVFLPAGGSGASREAGGRAASEGRD